jgi:Malectin domain/Family of unknown function (DUF6298)
VLTSRQLMYIFSCFFVFGSRFFALNSLPIFILTLVLLLFSLPGRSSAQQPQLFSLGVIAGGGSYTDSGGNRWNADQPYSQGSWGYVGGKIYKTSKSIANTNNDPLYQSERYGNFSYKFDVPNGLYNVALLFAEIYWETPGERIFDVFIEGSGVLDRYDICAAVGCNTALALTFPGVQVQDGQLNIDFVTIKDNAKISAISITSSDITSPAVFLDSPTTGTTFSPGQVVTATGSGQNLRWDIDRINDGLGSFATGQGNSITFTVPANSNASQFIRIILTGDGGTATRDYKIVASPPLSPVVSLTSPTASASFSPGQIVTATGSGQNLRWDIDRIGDGLPSFATGQGNSVTFTVPANSNASQFIRITLTGDGGTATRDYKIVASPPLSPVVSFTSPPAGTTFSPGQAVIATGSGQNLRWDIDRIGDGLPSFATGQGNSITFTVPTNSNTAQSIRITLMGDNGTATRDYSISVPPPPSPPPPPPPPSPPPFSMGPLKVHQSNPRYFTNGGDKAIYLTGSHNWQNFSDWGTSSPPPLFDFTAYLDFLQARKHNFIRLWRWEPFKFDYGFAYGSFWGRLHSEPHPWARTGPGTALDGGPKFNLNQFNQAYFDRLRQRVIDARDRGIYVSIMLFEGHALHSSLPPWRWSGHPMNASNNLNGINGDPNGDGYGIETQTLNIPSVTAIQKAYLRKVIDTVNDLDNVLYEIANESGDYSVQWQYEMVNFIKNYQAAKPKQHPVGMTVMWGNPPSLFDSPADWISPGDGGSSVYSIELPSTDGSKVIILDTDHLINNIAGTDPATRVWVWKSFMTGYNPIYMDPIPSITGDNSDYGTWSDGRGEDVRWAMGHTRSYADKMNMAAMSPRGDLSSTGYALANPGQEYLIYARFGGNFTVNLSGSSQNFRVEWFNPATGISSNGESVAGGAKRSFSPLFSGDAVLYLKADGI